MAQNDRESQLADRRRLADEYRRVGVNAAELTSIFRARFQSYLDLHPEIQAQIKQDPNYDPGDFALALIPDLRLKVLSGLPDGAGTAAFVDRLETLYQGRLW